MQQPIQQPMMGMASNIASFLQDENVMSLVKSQLNTQTSRQELPEKTTKQMENSSGFVVGVPHQAFKLSAIPQDNTVNAKSFGRISSKPKPVVLIPAVFDTPPPSPKPVPKPYENCPVFTPLKITDHNHKHTPTLSEILMEFRAWKVIDYHHQTTLKLKEFIKDIDIDKVVEKRKAVALRKKTLGYLKTVENPEDTVSNPKYPKNWEAVKSAREPPRNKRKKKMTPKIKTVLASQACNETFSITIASASCQELETISSDDDFDTEPIPIVKKKLYEEFDCAEEYDSPECKRYVTSEESDEAQVSFGPLKYSNIVASKWDNDIDPQDVLIDRLDGIQNKSLKRLSMADYLQSEWTLRPSSSGKKRVRWADIEHKRQRDLGFVVGQTNWNQIMDDSDGRKILEKIKFIEPREKRSRFT